MTNLESGSRGERKKEGPGFVRGGKTRGRGVETEAGPDRALWREALVHRGCRQQAEPPQLLVGVNHPLFARVSFYMTESREAGKPPEFPGREAEQHGCPALINLILFLRIQGSLYSAT